jgi:membrane-associated phospholipid phosphatase
MSVGSSSIARFGVVVVASRYFRLASVFMIDLEWARPWSPSVLATLAEKYPEAIDAKAFWRVIAAVIAIDAMWLWLSGTGVTIGIALSSALFLLIGANLFYMTVRPNRNLAALALMFAQLIVFASAQIVLIYLSVTSAFPLADSYLAAGDAAIGFDWLLIFNWVQEHPWVDLVLTLSYASIGPQACILPVILSIIDRLDRMREFLWLFAVTLLIVTPIAWLLPAESAWVHFGVTDRINAYHLADFTALRAGQMKEIIMAKVDGLVTFPSFHAALGLILIYVSRGIRILFPILLVLNVLMIASTPVEGGHYLVDILAGLAIVPVAAKILRSRQARLRLRTQL